MRRAFPHIVLCTALGLLGTCTQFPALDRTITPELQAADYPDFVPLEPVFAAARSGGLEPVQATAEIDARVSALKLRASRLRGSVLSGAERQRLEKGLH